MRSIRDYSGVLQDSPNSIFTFLCAEGWENRLVGAVDNWVARKMAVWVEKPRVFSINTRCDPAEKIKRENSEMDTVYAILAASIIAAVCHISTDNETYPEVRSVLPQMEFCRKYGYVEIDAGRNVDNGDVRFGVGISFRTRGQACL